MSKLRLIFPPNTPILSDWIRPIYSEYFSFHHYDPTEKYTTKDMYFYTLYNEIPDSMKQFRDSGGKIVVDSTNELYDLRYADWGYWLTHPNWFWYNDSLRLTHLNYGHKPVKTYTKLALMPMLKQRASRTELMLAMSPWLDDFIWSYVHYGRQLPDDLSADDITAIKPYWYDSTYFSMVSETTISHPFITEKTFKPIMHQHPFLIYGPPHHLESLHKMGFVTFDNLFDESYDLVYNHADRLKIITNNVRNFVREPYTAETLQRIRHNYNHFFDHDLVVKLIKQDIIEPLVEYAET